MGAPGFFMCGKKSGFWLYRRDYLPLTLCSRCGLCWPKCRGGRCDQSVFPVAQPSAVAGAGHAAAGSAGATVGGLVAGAGDRGGRWRNSWRNACSRTVQHCRQLWNRPVARCRQACRHWPARHRGVWRKGCQPGWAKSSSSFGCFWKGACSSRRTISRSCWRQWLPRRSGITMCRR